MKHETHKVHTQSTLLRISYATHCSNNVNVIIYCHRKWGIASRKKCSVLEVTSQARRRENRREKLLIQDQLYWVEVGMSIKIGHIRQWDGR